MMTRGLATDDGRLRRAWNHIAAAPQRLGLPLTRGTARFTAGICCSRIPLPGGFHGIIPYL